VTKTGQKDLKNRTALLVCEKQTTQEKKRKNKQRETSLKKERRMKMGPFISDSMIKGATGKNPEPLRECGKRFSKPTC